MSHIETLLKNHPEQPGGNRDSSIRQERLSRYLNMRRSTIALLLLLVVVSSAPFGTARADESVPDAATATFEVDFMTGMIDHHSMANEMAMRCQQKQVRSNLASLCSKIIADQTKEIGEMQGWLRDWYDETYEPMMMPDDMAMLRELDSLTGAAFETTFMTMMIEHHTTAIGRGRECLNRASHGDLLGLCETMVAAQSAEIQQMQAMLADTSTPSAPRATVSPAPPATGSGLADDRSAGGGRLLMFGAALILGAAALAAAARRRKVQ